MHVNLVCSLLCTLENYYSDLKLLSHLARIKPVGATHFHPLAYTILASLYYTCAVTPIYYTICGLGMQDAAPQTVSRPFVAAKLH